jgi:hypothetical protein
MVTVAVTVALMPLALTTNDAEYGVEEAAKFCVAKLTVSDPLFVPDFGETLSQAAVGIETDHFRAPLPELRIVTVWDGIADPAVAETLSVVGLTERPAAADAARGIISVLARKTHNRTATPRVFIGTPSLSMVRPSAACATRAPQPHPRRPDGPKYYATNRLRVLIFRA